MGRNKQRRLHLRQSASPNGMKYHYDSPGAIPGTLSIDHDAAPPDLWLIDYCADHFEKIELKNPADCKPYLDSKSVSWVDFQGFGNEAIVRQVGDVFGLHPLVLEDVVNVPQRPKVEDYDDQLVIIAQMVIPDEERGGFWNEQVSFVLGQSYLLTVQEEPQRDCFDPVRQRIEANKGLIRHHGADYLTYALLDAVIDGFFPVLGFYGERIEDLENEVIISPTPQTLDKIHQIRRDLLRLRRAIWPQREAINALIRDSSPLISDEVQIYLRDCYDHAIQVLDMVETYRELASSLMDVYLSSVSNRMNEIMKVLTVISTMFIPVTFIAGVYQMSTT
jgi:magnesium transporter